MDYDDLEILQNDEEEKYFDNDDDQEGIISDLKSEAEQTDRLSPLNQCGTNSSNNVFNFTSSGDNPCESISSSGDNPCEGISSSGNNPSTLHEEMDNTSLGDT